MKIIKKSVFLIFALLMSNNEASGQSRWVIQYLLDNYFTAGSDISTSYDEGYLISGSFLIPYYSSSWLLKTDVNGIILWQKTIDKEYYDYIHIDFLDHASTGEIFLCGAVNLYGSNWDPVIMKLNACGEKEWCRTLSNFSRSDYFKDVVCTPDGGCAGLLDFSYSCDQCVLGILRFSSEGELLWQNYYESQDQRIIQERMSNLLFTPDHGFLMSGQCTYPNAEDSTNHRIHPYFIKTDSLGNFMWEIILQHDIAEIGGRAFQTVLSPEGKYFYSSISHYYYMNEITVDRPALVKIDLMGNVIGINDLVHLNYHSGCLFSIAFINDSLLAGSASWRYTQDPFRSRAIVFDTNGVIKDSITLLDSQYLSNTAVTHNDKLLFLDKVNEDIYWDTYLFKLTQELEPDTFYTQPFVYDSLCPYQIISDTMVLDDCGVIVGIEEDEWTVEPYESMKGGMEIRPNPTTSYVNLRLSYCDLQGNVTFELYDIFGRLIPINLLSSYLEEGGRQSWQIDVSSLPPGIYLAVVKDEKCMVGSAKFVVAR